EWGPRWKGLINAMVKFEESMRWDDNNLPRSQVRPEEIAMWMKEHRKRGTTTRYSRTSGERMLRWWRDIGPEYRQKPRPEGLPESEEWPPKTLKAERPGAWCHLSASENNGMLLVVQALTWW
ncbi:hypothetical protein B0H14DRAFT_2229290, partial [Mycena olivaceomarginata]